MTAGQAPQFRWPYSIGRHGRKAVLWSHTRHVSTHARDLGTVARKGATQSGAAHATFDRARERHRPWRARHGRRERAAHAVPARLPRVLGRLGRGAAGVRGVLPCRRPGPARLCRAPPSPRDWRPTASSSLCATSWGSASTSLPADPSCWWRTTGAPRSPMPRPWRRRRASPSWSIINGVHPGPFQRALLEDDAQRQASSYMHYLRDPRAEERLSANNFEKLMGMLVRFGPQPWLTPEKRAGYLEAWSPPGALTGMLNWYRASPLLVPKPGEAIDPASQPLKLDPARFRVRMPHLVIWGMDDRALLPVTRADAARLLRRPHRARDPRRRPLGRAPEDGRGDRPHPRLLRSAGPARASGSGRSADQRHGEPIRLPGHRAARRRRRACRATRRPSMSASPSWPCPASTARRSSRS